MRYFALFSLLLFFLVNILSAGGDKTPKLSHDKYFDKKDDKCDKYLSVVTWNIGYGIKFEKILNELRKINADIYILQEVDKWTKRAKKKDVALELACGLGYNFVWSKEFEELSQRNSRPPLKSKVFTGQAILSRYPIKLLREFEFKNQAAKWSFNLFSIRSWPIIGQPRKGGRMAQIVEVYTPRGPIIVANTHLESSVPDKKKISQTEELLNAVLNERLRYYFNYPPTIIIAGDMNTSKGLKSPIVNFFKKNGFSDVFCKFSESSFKTTRTTPKGKRIDWIFVRGVIVHFKNAEVLNGAQGSDHYPLYALIQPYPFLD